MGFRFRKRLKFGPFALNFSKNGLSSLSIGGPGASINVPINRDGGVRQTVGLPGTGLSWTEEASSHRSVRERQQSQRRAPKVPSTEAIINDLMDTISGPQSVGDALWRQGLAQLVIDHPDAPRKVREAALLIRSPEAAELHCRRAKGQAATTRAALDVLNAIQLVLDWAREQGLAEDVD